jgi:hypothetical protein
MTDGRGQMSDVGEQMSESDNFTIIKIENYLI